MSPMFLLVVYCLLILLASLAGGWIPMLLRLTHRRMQLAVSLVAGVMLGVGLLHMLPHALLEAPDNIDVIFPLTMAGFLVMFFIERFFCFHHHDVPSIEGEHADEEHVDISTHIGEHSHRLTWSGAALGLTLHTVIAGIALAASVEVGSHIGHPTTLVGLGTFLVIFLHKPFDAMTISTLMTVGGWSILARHLVNGLFALMIPLGALLFYLGLGQAHEGSHLVSYALAFSAGTFLCIAMSDLLPELQFHSHDRIGLSIALLVGLSLAYIIGIIETQGHGHDHSRPAPAIEEPHHNHHGKRERIMETGPETSETLDPRGNLDSEMPVSFCRSRFPCVRTVDCDGIAFFRAGRKRPG